MGFTVSSNISSTSAKSFAASVTGGKPRVAPRGSPSERLWVLSEPLAKDADKGYLFSSPMGWSYDKLLREAGLPSYYAVSFVDTQEAVQALEQYKPPIILALDQSSSLLTKHIKRKEDVRLYSGSPISSDLLSFSHRIYPTSGPETCIGDWTERQIVKYVDLGKVVDDYKSYLGTGSILKTPERILDFEPTTNTIKWRLESFRDDPNLKYLSVDLENVYPRGKSQFLDKPGYPIVIGFAPDHEYGLSFDFWRETKEETQMLWRLMDEIFQKKEIIGQNFFGFDAWFLEMLGFSINRFKIHDTMFRHALLWPELSHKLEFQTRQYTRQIFYKEEGKGWSVKDMKRLRRYNALDVTVTYEIFMAQEQEFNERPHLR